MTKAAWRRESLFDHAFMSLLVIRGTEQEPEAGAEAETLENMAVSLHSTEPRDATTRNRLYPLASITN